MVSVGAYPRESPTIRRPARKSGTVRYEDGFSNVPRPVFGHGLVYIATGFLAARAAGGPGRWNGRRHVARTSPGRSRAARPSLLRRILVGDELYVVNDLGILSCVDAKTGKVLWQQRLGGNHSASPIFADGRLYFLSEEGVATVIAPGKTFQKLAVNELDGATLASMAVASGSFFIRSLTHLYRIANK